MGIPGYININDYNYILPEEYIAKYPLEKRDNSRLLYYHDGQTENMIFKELPDLLDQRQHLIFNDTRVIQARLLFNKSTGAVIEIFLLEPWQPSEYNLSFASKSECIWKCLAGNAKKWKTGDLVKKVSKNGMTAFLKANMSGREGNFFFIHFSWDNPKFRFSDIIEHAGVTPIPPYLAREPDASDSIRYQTVYSRYEGSVAAPTAGLHFTDEVFRKLDKKGILQTRLTLHVGAGTFVPVKTENARDHHMHTEHIYVSRKSIEELYLSDRDFIAVGTTSVRSLESIYHIAVKLLGKGPGKAALFLDQWEAYQSDLEISRNDSFEILIDYMDKVNTDVLRLSTRIMITPGYKFRMTDGMITNFHQPASTLLLLISAYLGEDWKKIYNYALLNQYRFLSYGDSSLLINTLK